MLQKRWIVSALVLVIVAVFLLSRKPSPTVTGHPSDETTGSQPKVEQTPLQTENIPQATTARVEGASLQSLSTPEEMMKPSPEKNRAAVGAKEFPALPEVIPSLELLRSQAAENPHGSPSALIEFAAEVAGRMQVALNSERAAGQFFPELEDCVLNPRQNGSHSVQGFCLVNARQLAMKYPSLIERLSHLTTQADPRSVELANKL